MINFRGEKIIKYQSQTLYCNLLESKILVINLDHVSE
jgi:hypothetical protein